MLAIAFALQTGNSTQHLQTERQILKLIFAFDQIKHARYNSFQHVLLSNLSKDNQKPLTISLKTDLELHLWVRLLVQFTET